MKTVSERTRRRRILVIEDDSATRALLLSGLSDDFEVEEAGNGRDAIDLLQAKSFDSLVLDMMMPIIDGFGVLHFLERQRPDLLKRVIVVTGADDQVIRLVPGEKVFGILTKPCGVLELARTIEQCCGDAQN